MDSTGLWKELLQYETIPPSFVVPVVVMNVVYNELLTKNVFNAVLVDREKGLFVTAAQPLIRMFECVPAKSMLKVKINGEWFGTSTRTDWFNLYADLAIFMVEREAMPHLPEAAEFTDKIPEPEEELCLAGWYTTDITKDSESFRHKYVLEVQDYSYPLPEQYLELKQNHFKYGAVVRPQDQRKLYDHYFLLRSVNTTVKITGRGGSPILTDKNKVAGIISSDGTGEMAGKIICSPYYDIVKLLREVSANI